MNHSISRKNIIIVDDEEDILELVKYNLTKEGYHIICATTGEEALKKAESTVPDLIVLDLMLPGINGLEVTKRLKENPHTRNILIIMLTAKGDEADIVAGLELGADDYVTKPFSVKILIARIQAVIRRQRHSQAGIREQERNVESWEHSLFPRPTLERNEEDISQIRIHDLIIHPGRHHVMIKDKPVDLTFTEFQLLGLLVSRPGWVFTRSQIVDAIRGEDYPVTDRSVDVQIVGLRKKLGVCGKYIETVRGVGYRFRENL